MGIPIFKRNIHTFLLESRAQLLQQFCTYSIYLRTNKLNGIKLSKVLYTQLLLNILNYKQLPVLLLEVALYKYVIE